MDLIINELSKIDYTVFLETFFPAFVFILSIKTMETNQKYKLIKESKPIEIKKVHIPPMLRIGKKGFNIQKLSSKVLQDKIFSFSNVLKTNFKLCDLKLFNYNVKNLNIEFDNNLYANEYKKQIGVYILGNNMIKIDNREDVNQEQVLYHELFHIASTIKNKNTWYSGFEQNDLRTLSTIGTGLNEGYTELLTSRYFETNPKSGYQYEIHIASKLEEIIGKEKMEKYYLNADLYHLVEDLCKYETKEDVIKFIKYFDLYEKKNKLCNKNQNNKEEIEKYLRYINEFILKCYLKKIRREIKENKIKKEHAISILNKYINSLGLAMTETTNNITYKYMSIEKLNEILSNIFYDENISAIKNETSKQKLLN